MYRTIDVSAWSDAKFRGLSPDGKLLLLYLITNPASHVSGLYHLSKETMVKQTGISRRRLDILSDTLSRLRIALFDYENDMVFVVNMAKHQGRHEKLLQAAVKQIENFRNSFLASKYLEQYPDIKERLSDTLLNRVGNTVPVPSTVPDAVPKDTSRARGKKADDYSEGFLKFWKAYPKGPRKTAKAKCYARWEKDKLNEKADHVLAVLEAMKKSDDWVKEGGKYIPGTEVWLNQQRWDTELENISTTVGGDDEYADGKF